MGGEHVNFLGRDTGSEARALAIAAYGADKYERLAAVKRSYDPTNFFRLNHNILPA